MNILILGGAGYIGTELVYALAQELQTERITVYDNLARGNHNLFIGQSKINGTPVRFVRAELLDTRRLAKELTGIDVVYHLAAKVTTPFANHNPHEFEQVNNWGTAELTYLLEKSKVKRLIYTSSVSVYGSSDTASDTDTTPNPKTFYGISKMRGEQHVERLIDSPIETFVLRCGNVYGYSKSMRFDSVINKFIFEAHFSGRLRIIGDGHQHRSFIHIDRLSKRLTELALEHLPAGTYNLVEHNYSINDVVERLTALYPGLEMLFVNQNLKMRNLMVKPDYRISSAEALAQINLQEDLKAFQGNFTFG